MAGNASSLQQIKFGMDGTGSSQDMPQDLPSSLLPIVSGTWLAGLVVAKLIARVRQHFGDHPSSF
jgi:hypothetical protein